MLTIARLSLCFAPLFLLACIDDDAELPDVSEDISERSAAGQQATLMTIDLTQYPDAMCNDGTAPVVKVKLDQNGGNNWLVYLQGGGSCSSVADCEERWTDCSSGAQYPGDPIGWKGNMTANTGGMNFDGWGILDFDGHSGEASPFAGKGFNRVFIPYCSSDQWRGLGNTQAVNYAPTCNDPGALTTLHFGGGKIVEAVVDEIMAGSRAPQDENFVVLAGGSAGGRGVQYNLDRVADQIHALEPETTVVGIADAAYSVGLDQDGIPTSALDAELFWAGLDPATVFRSPGDPIDVVVDESCFDDESGADKDYCHDMDYMVTNHMGTPLMLTSNTYDPTSHEATFEAYDAGISDCGGQNHHTNGANPDQDALYTAYCNPVVDPSADVETWIRYQTGAEGTAILDTVSGSAYYLVHSSLGLHDQLLKESENFFRRATSPTPANPLGGYEFAGLGGWTSASGQNVNPSIASTVACALGLVGLPGAPTCSPDDVRVTSDLPTQVPVIENAFN
jgi:hypothetical protein